MNIIKIMEQRHSVRQYEDKKIEAKKRNILLKEIEAVNKCSCTVRKQATENKR